MYNDCQLQKTIVAFFLFFMFLLPLFALDCPNCGARDLTPLSMLCSDCGGNLYGDHSSKAIERSALLIRLYYTGDNPNNLSNYAKFFVNGKYMGNIELIEKQGRNEEAMRGWSSGIGSDFTAMYEREFRDIPVGQVKVEVELRFNRLFGYGRSYKRVVFPYVMISRGSKTVIEHYFYSAKDFCITDKSNKKKPNMTAKKGLPIISDTKVKTATGTVGLDIGLFK